jgi:exodeoxyribonuclease V alpha subunit
MSKGLQRLREAGIVGEVDAALGALIARQAPPEHSEALGIAAALAHAALAHGHSCLPLARLHEFVAQELAADANSAKLALRDLPTVPALRAALLASPLVAREAATPAALVFDANERIYLRRYHRYEQQLAVALRERLAVSNELPDAASLRAALTRLFGTGRADRDQCIAVLLALRSRFLLVTGGPGSGKTSSVLRMLALRIEQALERGQPPPRIALTAPTGKAAARLSESLRAPVSAASEAVRAHLPSSASTLHRLLGITPTRAQPRYHREHPLPCDLVVVDEASMLDLALAARLCAALAPTASLILLGDRDQLASVEAGSVFGALCAAVGEPNRYSPATRQWLKSILSPTHFPVSEPPYGAQDSVGMRGLTDFDVAEVEQHKALPIQASPSYEREAQVSISNATPSALSDAVVELRSSHRFAAHSAIGRFARAVRAGDSDGACQLLRESCAELRSTAVPEQALTKAVLEQIVPRFETLALADSPQAALDQLERFRVLCALREGPFGATAINALTEHELRRRSSRIDAQGWFAGRLVMIRSNDYAQGLFNGDIGVALPTAPQGEFEVWLRNADGTPRAIPCALLPAHEGAFALTVHKAQGSEFDDVLLILPKRDARVLTRELLYTAVTRAREKVELWTNTEMISTIIARRTQRWSGLADALDTFRA